MSGRENLVFMWVGGWRKGDGGVEEPSLWDCEGREVDPELRMIRR